MRIISIDPDVRKCGIAMYEDGRLIYCSAVGIWHVFDAIALYGDAVVIIEDGRLIKCATWHAGGRGAALNVGKSQAPAIQIEDYCKCFSRKYVLVRPQGYSKMFADVELFKKTTGFTGRTNLDARAAAAIGWNFRNIKDFSI